MCRAERCFAFNDWVAPPEATCFHILTLPLLHPPPGVRASAKNSPSPAFARTSQWPQAHHRSGQSVSVPGQLTTFLSASWHWMKIHLWWLQGSGPRSAFISHTSNYPSRWLSFVRIFQFWIMHFLQRASRVQILRLIAIQKHKHKVLERRDLFSSIPESPRELRKKEKEKRTTHVKAPALKFWFGSYEWEPGHSYFLKNPVVVLDIQPGYALKTNRFESDKIWWPLLSLLLAV